MSNQIRINLKSDIPLLEPSFTIEGVSFYLEDEGVVTGVCDEEDGEGLTHSSRQTYTAHVKVNHIRSTSCCPNSAKATMSYKGVTAFGVFTFNEKGEILNFVAQRYGDFDGGYRMETWCAEIKEYKEFNGFKVPSQGDIIWKFKTGDFHWYHFQVKEIEYNKLARY